MSTKRIIKDLDFHIGHMIVRGDPDHYIDLLKELRDYREKGDTEAVEEVLTRPEFPDRLVNLYNNICRK